MPTEGSHLNDPNLELASPSKESRAGFMIVNEKECPVAPANQPYHKRWQRRKLLADCSRQHSSFLDQLAVTDQDYKEYAEELLSANPFALQKSMVQQFSSLVIRPYTQGGVCSDLDPLSIFIDGPDEGEREKTEVMDLIVQFVTRFPSASLLWIVISRPESHLKNLFPQSAVHPVLWEMDIPIDTEGSRQDVGQYLWAKLNKIHQKYCDAIPFALGE